MHSERRRRRTAALLIAIALVGVSCTNRGETATPTTTDVAVTTPATDPPSTAEPGGQPTSAPAIAPTTAPGVMFGDLPSPCGPGEATIAEGQNGGDTLVLATATDRGAVAAPGLTKEMYDAATAFAAWCNEQGGIGGLMIEVLDADGKLFEVPGAMEQVCAQAFAMVGGGWAFDDQQFPRFHECDMIDIAGYTVSTAKAMSDGMAQPVPNPSDARNVGWFQWAQESHPDDVARFATMYPDLLSTRIVEEQYIEELASFDAVEVVDRIPYNAAGEPNWAPFVQRLKDNDVTALAFVGSPEQLSPFLRATAEIGYKPNLILEEANMYTPALLEQGNADGVIVRSSIVPFEEADRSKAVADFLAIMAEHNQEGKLGMLGMQGMSAFLLFATGAKSCLAANENVLERQCVLDHVKAITDWTAGGLQAPSDPGRNAPTECTMLMVVRDGGFTRLYPELGSADDDGNGFACDPAQVMALTGDYGDVNAGKDPSQ
jgi:ABC-type branched-subunit amino acid transport system substrate-binding protein